MKEKGDSEPLIQQKKKPWSLRALNFKFQGAKNHQLGTNEIDRTVRSAF